MAKTKTNDLLYVVLKSLGTAISELQARVRKLEMKPAKLTKIRKNR